jgi:hypothetical protein
VSLSSIIRFALIDDPPRLSKFVRLAGPVNSMNRASASLLSIHKFTSVLVTQTLSIVWCPVPGFSIAHNRPRESIKLRKLVLSISWSIVCMQSDSRVARTPLRSVCMHRSAIRGTDRSIPSILMMHPLRCSSSKLLVSHDAQSSICSCQSQAPSTPRISSIAVISGGCPASWFARRASSLPRSKSSQARSRSVISGLVSGKPCFRGIRILEFVPKSFPLASLASRSVNDSKTLGSAYAPLRVTRVTRTRVPVRRFAYSQPLVFPPR